MDILLYSGSYQSETVVVEVAKPNVNELVSAKCGLLDSDHSQQNLDRCFLLRNRCVILQPIYKIFLFSCQKSQGFL